MNEGRLTTITVNLPVSLKAVVEAFLDQHSMTLTGMVRGALQEAITPHLGPQDLPGFRAELTAALKRERVLLLLAADSSGNRFYVEGVIDHALTNDSLVTLWSQAGDPTSRVVILRRDVIAWFEGGARSTALCAALRQRGWVALATPWSETKGK